MFVPRNIESISCTVTFYNAEDVGLACWEAYAYGQLSESEIKINTEEVILMVEPSIL
jgi:hypothetical protein